MRTITKHNIETVIVGLAREAGENPELPNFKNEDVQHTFRPGA